MTIDMPSVLRGPQLSGTIQAVKPGLPSESFHPGFQTLSPSGVEGNTTTYFRVEGTRKTAQLVAYGGASKARTMKGVTEVPITLLSFAENIGVKPSTLVNLLSTDGSRQRLGEKEIARQVAEAKQILSNTRLAALASALLTGRINFSSAGHLLPTTSGAQITVDFGVPSGNRDQLNVFGTGAIIAASWATAGTKIVTHIQNLQAASLKLTGYALRNAIYGENILDYFLNNTQMKEIINRFGPYQSAFSQGIIPDGFLGLKWWPGHQFFYEDSSDTIQTMLGVDGVVFHPDPDPLWVEWKEGSTPTPSSTGLEGSDLEDALASVDLTQGMYSYGKVTDDPVGCSMVYGDVFMPIIKVPKAVFIADVTP